MKLKKYQVNNIPFVAIVDDSDCPFDPYVSAYLSTLSGQAFNTQLRKSNELVFVLGHFSKKRIDLAARVESGQFISDKEYLQFHEACCLQKNRSESSVVPLQNITDKTLRNAIAANQRQMARVANETQQGRIRRLREYLETLFLYFHDSHSVDEDTSDRFNQLTARIKLDEDTRIFYGISGTRYLIRKATVSRSITNYSKTSANTRWAGLKNRLWLKYITTSVWRRRQGSFPWHIRKGWTSSDDEQPKQPASAPR